MRRAYRDPGLQPERTRLAWRRTTLTCTATVALAARAALRAGADPAPWLLCALCLLLWLAFLALSHHRIRSLAASTPRLLVPRLALAAAACTTALALCAAALVV